MCRGVLLTNVQELYKHLGLLDVFLLAFCLENVWVWASRKGTPYLPSLDSIIR